MVRKQYIISLSPVAHIYLSVNYAMFGYNNGLSPVRRQAMIKFNPHNLLNESLGTNYHWETKLVHDHILGEVPENTATSTNGVFLLT